MDGVKNIIAFDSIATITICVFLFIIILVVIKFLLFKDTKEKSMQKIIGGLSVFIIAIISKNPWVFSLSLFIGGLLIASEKFMRSLAAILRSDSAGIAEIIRAEAGVDISPATSSEIKEKNRKDNEEQSLSSREESEDGRLKEDRKNYLQKSRLAERLVSEFFSQKYYNRYTPNVKLENRYGSIIIDGTVHYSADKDRLNLDNVLGLVEIKYIRSLDSEFLIEIFIKRALERIRFLFISKQLMVVFVSEKITKDLTQKIKKKFKEKYRNVTLAFFNLNKNETLEPVLAPELKEDII